MERLSSLDFPENDKEELIEGSEGDWRSLGLEWTIETAIYGIAAQLRIDMHGPLMTNPTNFGDPLTFPLAPPAGQSFYLPWEI